MGHSAKKLTLIIYTMQACVSENTGFKNMDYPIQTPAPLHNTIWTTYNQGGKDEEDGVSRKTQSWKEKRGRKQEMLLTRKQEEALQGV